MFEQSIKIIIFHNQCSTKSIAKIKMQKGQKKKEREIESGTQAIIKYENDFRFYRI